MKLLTAITVAAITCAAAISEAKAGGARCVVTDPTGTPLNVRDSPNGQIVNALQNGRKVNTLRLDYDEQGRPWSLIGGDHKGNYRVWGWVLREFVSCY